MERQLNHLDPIGKSSFLITSRREEVCDVRPYLTFSSVLFWFTWALGALAAKLIRPADQSPHSLQISKSDPFAVLTDLQPSLTFQPSS